MSGALPTGSSALGDSREVSTPKRRPMPPPRMTAVVAPGMARTSER